jgi:hypothetical protein
MPDDDVINDNGIFKIVDKPDDHHDDPKLPGGTWINSAKNPEYHDGLLVADLKDKNGRWCRAKIKCTPDDVLENNDGKFKHADDPHHHPDTPP